ncbi:cupin [Piscinibacter sp.]|jgi:quercetin dioxygenase-like cupin family protein|uniref:cupin n=1 Tax=Piscinibacter sp. TaxID=1903157 RepID=UPI00355A9F60
MALEHARPGEVIELRPLADQLASVATHALLKTRSLELMRIVLAAGQGVPRHSVQGEVTIQCIEGVVRVDAQVGSCELRPGQLVLLPAQDSHALLAIKAASLLVTVQLPAGLPGSDSSTH